MAGGSLAQQLKVESAGLCFQSVDYTVISWQGVYTVYLILSQQLIIHLPNTENVLRSLDQAKALILV